MRGAGRAGESSSRAWYKVIVSHAHGVTGTAPSLALSALPATCTMLKALSCCHRLGPSTTYCIPARSAAGLGSETWEIRAEVKSARIAPVRPIMPRTCGWL